MKHICALLIVCMVGIKTKVLISQTIYFPPLSGSAWNTLPPDSLNWCNPQIDSLYTFLEDNSTDGFIVLKDGKIVLEKYFGTFTTDSIHYWASAGKSLTAFLTGLAQENGFLNINNSVTTYLGSGWTSCTSTQENKITIKNLLTMTSGLDESPGSGCATETSTPACLQYYTDTSVRWAYHTGAYRVIEDIIAAASGTTYNAFTNNAIEVKTGMSGAWFGGVYYSKLRDMARFGLLMLNKGIWDNDTLMHDTSYYNAMINTSQPYNLSYGYLWWLNGKPSFMVPFWPTPFSSAAIPNAPADMYCALGKNDQKIYVVPSQNLVVVRMGDAADSSTLALSGFDNTLWQKINELNCTGIGINENYAENTQVFPVPFTNQIEIRTLEPYTEMVVIGIDGKQIYKGEFSTSLNTRNWLPGLYFIRLNHDNHKSITLRVIKQP